jgi:hypothetical protein
MAEDSMDNPLAGIDLDLLSSGGTGSTFDLRGADDEDNDPIIPLKEEDEDLEGAIVDKEDLEEIIESDYKGITLKDDEDEDLESLEEGDESGVNQMWEAFSDAGIIELDEDELDGEAKDMEWFAGKTSSKIEKGIDEGIESYKESLPDDLKFLIDNHDAGVSLIDLAKAESKIMEYATIEDEDLEDNSSLQKKLVRDALKLQGESDTDIDEALMDYEDSGLLEKQAKRSKRKLVSHQKNEAANLIANQKEVAANNKKKYDDWYTGLKSDIDKKEEIIPGLKLNDKQKKTLFSGITKIDKDGKNDVMKFREANPEFDLVVAYMATVLKTKDNKIDWSKLTEVAETKAVKGLKKKSKDGSARTTSSRRSLKEVDINIMQNAIKLK